MQPVVRGRNVCHWHGGRAGAPKGSQNGFIHGRATKEAIAAQKAERIERRRARRLVKLATQAVERVTRRKRKIDDAAT